MHYWFSFSASISTISSKDNLDELDRMSECSDISEDFSFPTIQPSPFQQPPIIYQFMPPIIQPQTSKYPENQTSPKPIEPPIKPKEKLKEKYTPASPMYTHLHAHYHMDESKQPKMTRVSYIYKVAC